MTRLPFPQWLTVACCVLCSSLQAADTPQVNAHLASGPAWCQSLQLSGVTVTNGEYCVYLFNPTTGAVTTLTLGEPPYNGLKLEALENADDPARCSVVVSRNGERAVFRPIDDAIGAAPVLTSTPAAKTVVPAAEASEEKPAVVRDWNGPRFDLGAAKAAAAERRLRGD